MSLPIAERLYSSEETYSLAAYTQAFISDFANPNQVFLAVSAMPLWRIEQMLTIIQ